ncbi:MAG: hypothetical protein IT256_04405 [Chitinophagaceae bacterium]|nr:hypothetical protein [Chitinophagaceae bacterium]
MWWYGWGFGARPMVETYAILSIPLAALIAWLGTQKLVVKTFSVLVFGFFIWLNIYQTEQYSVGTIHGEYMNQKYYWRIWNKMHPSPEDNKFLNL